MVAGELAQARQRLASLEREIGRQQQLVPVAPAPIAGCQRRNRFVEHLRRERGAQRHLCDEARCRHDRASGAVSEARERLAQAAAASAQVEQHRRDWDRARWRAEQRRAEEELEELTTARVARERG